MILHFVKIQNKIENLTDKIYNAQASKNKNFKKYLYKNNSSNKIEYFQIVMPSNEIICFSVTTLPTICIVEVGTSLKIGMGRYWVKHWS